MIVDEIRRFLSDSAIPPCPILVAVSGGVDSSALLLALVDLRPEGFTITAGHVNHHLRGEESDGDERFVRELCEAHGVPLEVADGHLPAERIRAVGIEAAAREVRHDRLASLARQSGARYVATAHQREDQAETVLMRMITGTGLAGLRGIHPVREDGWIRPLLGVRRGDIEAFLRDRGVTPRLDRMNADARFLRARVRQLLQELGPSVSENLAGLASQAQQVWPLIDEAIDAADRVSTRVAADQTRFHRWPENRWLRQALLLRHIRRLGSARDVSSRDLERLAASLDATQRVSVTRELELIRRRGALVLRRVPEPVGEFAMEIGAGESVYIPAAGATLTVAELGLAPPSLANVIQLPEGGDPRFVVRNRRRGDRFQPLGMERDKKLKDFLIDRKIPAEARDALPLLVWGGEIAWVAGLAVSERFKVTSPRGPLYEVKLASTDDDHRLDRDRD